MDLKESNEFFWLILLLKSINKKINNFRSCYIFPGRKYNSILISGVNKPNTKCTRNLKLVKPSWLIQRKYNFYKICSSLGVYDNKVVKHDLISNPGE